MFFYLGAHVGWGSIIVLVFVCGRCFWRCTDAKTIVESMWDMKHQQESSEGMEDERLR